MEFKTEANFILVKLEDGEDLLDELENVARQANLLAGMIISGIGMLRNLELGYFNGKNYIRRKFKGPMELVALHGTIAEGGIHLHCGLADKENKLYGGHLFKAQVSVANEILILKLESIKLKRGFDKKLGLKVLKVE